MKKLKKNRGITLVALIVTIIILLILAGVTIAILSGENGILSRTEKATTTYQTESIKEIVNLKLANLNAGKWIDEGRRAVLKDLNELDDESSSNFDTEITLKNSVVDSDTKAILIYDQHEIEVDSLLNIIKIDGEKSSGTSGGTNNGESGSTSGGNSGSIDSAEYAKIQETIAQMQEKINELEAKNEAIEENYATKQYVDDLPTNVANYTDLNWTLIATAGPYENKAFNVNLDEYNYICVTIGNPNWGEANQSIVSVHRFKEKFNSDSCSLYSIYDSSYNAQVKAYYDGTLHAISNYGDYCYIYGIK